MDARLTELCERYLESCLDACEATELQERLRASAEARRDYWDYIEQHALIEDVLSESRGRDLALAESSDPEEVALPVGASVRRRFSFQGWIGASLAAIVCVVALWWRLGGEDRAHAPFGESQSSWGTVQALAGDVLVIDSSGKSAAAVDGFPVAPGQTLRVGDGDAAAELHLKGGGQVKLSPGSVLRIGRSDATGGKQLHLEKGAAQVQAVEEASGKPMILSTDHAQIRGTAARYRLYRESTASRVELEEGQVRLVRSGLPDGGETLDVAEGSFVVADNGTEPMVCRPLASARVRLRHTFLNGGRTAAFSGEGRYLVASGSQFWKAWTTADGSSVPFASDSRQIPFDVAVAADRDSAVALDRGGGVGIWKIGEPRATLTHLRDKGVRHGAVSPDGRWLAQATAAGEVSVWEADFQSGSISLRRTIAIRPSRVALSADGLRVAVSQWDGAIRVFDMKGGMELATHKLQSMPTPLTISADGNAVAAYAQGDGLILFDHVAATRTVLWSGEGAKVACLTFSADGRALFAGLEDGTVRAWNVKDGSCRLVFDAGHQVVNRVAVTVDQSLLATVGDGDCIKIWETQRP